MFQKNTFIEKVPRCHQETALFLTPPPPPSLVETCFINPKLYSEHILFYYFYRSQFKCKQVVTIFNPEGNKLKQLKSDRQHKTTYTELNSAPHATRGPTVLQDRNIFLNWLDSIEYKRKKQQQRQENMVKKV